MLHTSFSLSFSLPFHPSSFHFRKEQASHVCKQPAFSSVRLGTVGIPSCSKTRHNLCYGDWMRWKRSQNQVTNPGTTPDPGWISQRHGIKLGMTGLKKKSQEKRFLMIFSYIHRLLPGSTVITGVSHRN